MNTQAIDRIDIRSLVETTIKQFSKSEDAVLTDNSKLNELGMDSLDVMELIFQVEETYAISIDENQVSEFETLGELMAEIYERVSASPVS